MKTGTGQFIAYTLAVIFTVTLAAILFGMLLMSAVDTHEVVECTEWKELASDFHPHYYLTQWQVDQCAAHGITIDAPVR